MQYTAKNLTFPTGSSYAGAWSDERACMHGFGCYKYPDGSEFHGYFTNGVFHGYGSLKLGAPHNFTIEGYFKNGKLTNIEKMYFDDGVQVKAQLKGNKLDFSEWLYCSPEDRRFPAEVINGLRGPPYAPTTKNPEERKLKVGEYDTEQGVYKAQTGFIMKRAPPYTPAAYLSCKDEIKWIKQHCRDGTESTKAREPAKGVCQNVVETNIESQTKTDVKYGEKCQNPGYKYFAKLYAQEMAEAKKVMNKLFAGSGTYGGLGKNRFFKEAKSSGSLVAEKSLSGNSFQDTYPKDPKFECELGLERGGGPVDSFCLAMSLMNIGHKVVN